MKIYTKTGDNGETSLFGGERVSKSSLRVETYGTIDELNSYIGLCLSYILKIKSDEYKLKKIMITIQKQLFSLGSLTAFTKGTAFISMGKSVDITTSDIEFLEKTIDKLDESLTPLTMFILPTGSTLSSQFQVARTIARKAERCMIRLGNKENIPKNSIKYLNRLSDTLFTLARIANKIDTFEEIPWH